MSFDLITLSFFLLFLGFLLVCIIRMFFCLLRLGDERRQMIVGKACTFSFTGTVGYLLLSVLRAFFQGQTILLNPLITLSTVAILFTCSLAWYQRKLGGDHGKPDSRLAEVSGSVPGGTGERMRGLPSNHQCH